MCGCCDVGRKLGYPECCIAAFHIKSHIVSPRVGGCGPKERRKLWGSGFVPCRECHQTKTEVQLILEINANRQIATPFTGRRAPIPLEIMPIGLSASRRPRAL